MGHSLPRWPQLSAMKLLISPLTITDANPALAHGVHAGEWVRCTLVGQQ